MQILWVRLKVTNLRKQIHCRVGFFSPGLSPLSSCTTEVPRCPLTKSIHIRIWDKWLHQLYTCYRLFWQSVKLFNWMGFISWKNTIKMPVTYKITSMNIYILMSTRYNSYFMKSVWFWLTFLRWKCVREETMPQGNCKTASGFRDIGTARVRSMGTCAHDVTRDLHHNARDSSQSGMGKTRWWVNRTVEFLPSLECNLIELLFIVWWRSFILIGSHLFIYFKLIASWFLWF